jgi:hypothetical protein
MANPKCGKQILLKKILILDEEQNILRLFKTDFHVFTNTKREKNLEFHFYLYFLQRKNTE